MSSISHASIAASPSLATVRLALSICDFRSLLEVLLLLPPVAGWRILHCRQSSCVAGRRVVLPHVGQFLGRVPRVRVSLSHVGASREAAAGAPGQRAGAVRPAALGVGYSEKGSIVLSNISFGI